MKKLFSWILIVAMVTFIFSGVNTEEFSLSDNIKPYGEEYPEF